MATDGCALGAYQIYYILLVLLYLIMLVQNPRRRRLSSHPHLSSHMFRRARRYVRGMISNYHQLLQVAVAM